MDNETKIKKIRSVFKTFNREFAESYLDDKIPDWRELVPEWQSITQLPPGSPGRWDWPDRDLILEGEGTSRGVYKAEDEIIADDDVRKESQEKLPAKVDLSNKELQVRIEDELKNLLEAIRASVDLYPEDLPQYQHEQAMFTSDKPQEISLEDYPNIHKLVKSRIVETLRKGGGMAPYEPRRSEMFANGVIDFYEQSKGLTTAGYFDVDVISELGFRSVPEDLKEFMKDAGISGQRGLSRGLREVFRYFTGSFKQPGKAAITTAYSGRNPALQEILESIPFLAPVGEGRYIIANRLESDASDLGPVYEKYMNVKPGTRTLPEQMQLLEDTTGTGTVRSMIDPSRQVQPLETKQQNDIFRHLIRKFNEEGGLPKERPVDVAAIRSKFSYMKNHYAREAAIRRAVQDAEQAAKKAGPIRGYQEKKKLKKLEFQPDLQPEQVEEQIPEEELKKIPISGKPKKPVKPSGSGSSLAETLRQRAEARLKAADQKAAKRLGIPYDPERTTAKTAEKVPVKKAEKVPTLTKKQAAAAARQKTFKYAAGPRTSTGELRGFRGRGEWGDPTRKTQRELAELLKKAQEAAAKKAQKREQAEKRKPKKAAKEKVTTEDKEIRKKAAKQAEKWRVAKEKRDAKERRPGGRQDPTRRNAPVSDDDFWKPGKKPDLKGIGLFWMLEQLLHTVPGMGLVDEEGRPVATLDEQMTKLTG